MDIEAINEQIARGRRGRKWIVVIDAAAAATRIVERLNEQNADSIMIVAPSEGVGDVPDVGRTFYTRTSGESIIPAVRAFVQSIEEPSDRLLEAIDTFDAQREAHVLNTGFSRATEFFGRPTYGPRKPDWRALEDKMIVDELWDTAGVTRAPAEIVPVAEAASHAEHLAGDLGTVWVADNKEGWHGGGAYLRWVRDRHDIEPAIEWFTEHADRVRVMPFLDGIPCSIHGFITHNGIAVFNPVELTILRHVNRPALYYAQGSNFWNAPHAVKTEMRSAARSVGQLLSERVGYLGAFGIDGICTIDGFRPTELNPRFSLGHNVHSAAAEVPLWDMEWSMLAGELEIDAADLETTLLTASETIRRGGAMFEFEDVYPAAKTGFIMNGDKALAADAEADEIDGTMEIGEAAFGTAIFARFTPERTPVGPSTAPRALAVLDLARELWNVRGPDLEPAPDLCT